MLSQKTSPRLDTTAQDSNAPLRHSATIESLSESAAAAAAAAATTTIAAAAVTNQQQETSREQQPPQSTYFRSRRYHQ